MEDAVDLGSGNKKSGTALQWKGLQVEVPGEVFYQPGTSWNGRIVGLSARKTASMKNRVYVKFDEDDNEYWFEKSKVIDWLTDRRMAEALRPMLQTSAKRGRRRSSSRSGSSVNSETSQEDPMNLPGANGAGHPSSLENIPESDDGELEFTHKSGDGDGAGNSGLPPSDREENPLSPPNSIARRIGRWMSGRFRGEKQHVEFLENEGQDDEDDRPRDAETEEDILNEEDLREVTGDGEDYKMSSPPKRGVWKRISDVFCTPMSSLSWKAPGTQQPQRMVEIEHEEVAGDPLRPRYQFDKPRLRILNPSQESPPRGEPMRSYYYRSPQGVEDITADFYPESDFGDFRKRMPVGGDLETPNTDWHCFHAVFVGAILVAWVSCAYYALWAEKTVPV